MEVIKYIQFAFTYDKEQLQQEVSSLNHRWIAHFNKAHYTGEWSALPLRSFGGSETNVIPDVVSTLEYKDTILMDECPYTRSIIYGLPGIKKAVRLLKLQPGAVIMEHTDAGLCYERDEMRIHIPITTNPGVLFYTDGEKVELAEGECWYINFDLPHSISNTGDTDRVHLVIDCIVDPALKQMVEHGRHTKMKKVEKYSQRDKLLIAAELRRLNTDVSVRLAEEIE